jgi:hypothetical protein
MVRRWIVVAGLLLSGCAMSGPTGSEIVTGSLPSGAARLVIYRTSPFGLAIQPDYMVDGQRVAASQPNGFVLCELPAGRHEVAVANMIISQNLFGVGSDKVTVDMRPGTTTYFHAQVQYGLTAGALSLMQVADNQGRADIANLHKIDGTCRSA